jgi:hypothetical protein
VEPSVGLQGLLSAAAGIGLAAATGFRVFLPLLLAGFASRLGVLPLAPGFDWIASVPALAALTTATLLEIGAYYVPWLDHALDLVATPTAVLAGMVASLALITDLPPALRWGIGIVGGGGAAGLIQGASVLLRMKSGALTGGAGNPAVATAELLGAAAVALLAIALPLVALLLTGTLILLIMRSAGRIRFGRRASVPPPESAVSP